MQQFEVFWKILENLQGKTVMETIFRKGLGQGCFSISFPNIFLWLLPNIEQKRIPLNDNIVWSKYSKVIKDLSKRWKLFLIKCPEILRRETFLFFLHANFTYFLKYIPLKKTSWNVKGFFVKISPLRIS